MVPIYVWLTLVPKRGKWHTSGEWLYLPLWRMWVLIPLLCAIGEVGPLWVGGDGLPEMEGQGVLQDLIPDVWQMVLPQVPAEGWVIDSNEHGLLDGPSDIVHFSAHNEKTVLIDMISCRLTELINGVGGSMVFLKHVSKDSSQFPNVFILTVCLDAFEPVYYLTLLDGFVLVLGSLGVTKRVLMVL